MNKNFYFFISYSVCFLIAVTSCAKEDIRRRDISLSQLDLPEKNVTISPKESTEDTCPENKILLELVSHELSRLTRLGFKFTLQDARKAAEYLMNSPPPNPVLLIEIYQKNIRYALSMGIWSPHEFYDLVSKEALQILESVSQYLDPNDYIVLLWDLADFVGDHNIHFPVMGYSRHKDRVLHIVLPDYEAIRGLHQLQNIFVHDIPCEEKIPLGFFRGSGNTSLKLNTQNWLLSSRYFLAYQRAFLLENKLADIGLTQFPPHMFSTPQDYHLLINTLELLPPASWSEQLQYRFLISLDGISYGFFRDATILSSLSVLLKAQSPYISWYHRLLEPYVNVVFFEPLQVEDLAIKTVYLQKNPKIACQIAENGKKLRWVFETHHVMSYILFMLKEYRSHVLDTPYVDNTILDIAETCIKTPHCRVLKKTHSPN